MKKAIWSAGTWNVRSMVDTEGSIEVASQATGEEMREKGSGCE